MKEQVNLQRRNCLKTITLSSVALLLFQEKVFSFPNPKLPKWLLAKIINPNSAIPIDKTIPFDWSFTEIPSNDNGLKLIWQEQPKLSKSIHFRITSATDIREEVLVGVFLSNSGKLISNLEMSFAHYMQPFELKIPQEDVEDVFKNGIYLKKVKGNSPLWIFADCSEPKTPPVFCPHLVDFDSFQSGAEWKNRLLSNDSLQTFGWMEGCVLDGIYDLAKNNFKARNVFKDHLKHYFSATDFYYEGYNNQKVINAVNNVESLLPFAMLATLNPSHPAIQTAINFCVAQANENGVVADIEGNKRKIKTEECYTVSYPLALLSTIYKRTDLMNLAIATLKERFALLTEPNAIYQRKINSDNPLFENWSRGVCWLLLGSVKTIVLLPECEDKTILIKELHSAVNFVQSHQQENGLWYCFLDDSASGIETSGSVGIAAALAFGYRNGLLDIASKKASKKAINGLKSYFTPDGFLKGTAQVNKGGEALQRNGFRVISPYTLGLYGILEASILK